LHWSASSDDVELLDALLDGGADIEVPGPSIADGTPLDDAVGYGHWRAAHRLVERGAKVGKLWHAAALGIMSRVEEHFAGSAKPTPDAVNEAFWQACHGGQRQAAEYLFARGAELNWIPSWAERTPLARISQMTSFAVACDLRNTPEKQGSSANSCHPDRKPNG
jgi:ankyrin repeat protein